MASTTELVTDSVADLRKSAPEKSFKEMTMRERFVYVKEVITIEPIIAAYIVASTLCAPSLYNLEIEKTCRSNFAFNDSICDAILRGQRKNFSTENDQIQAVISNMHSWQIPLQSFMPLILVLFLGSFSDRHKLRKPFILIPIYGEFFAVAGCILCVIFMKEWPVAVQGIAQTVVPSFFGGPTMLVMAVFSYIADVSSVEMRTLRVGMVQIVLNFCLIIAQALSGIVYKQIGYIWTLLIAALLFLFAILYGTFYVKEPKKSELGSPKTFIADAFDPKHAIDTVNLLLKKSPGNKRIYIIAVLVILFVFNMVATGESSILYLYVQGQFGWGPLEYSFYSTVNTIVHLIGTLVGVPVFTRFFNLTDPAILIISFLDKIISNIVYALARVSAVFYAGSVVGIITGLSAIALRSLGTKVVSPNDLGKAQSLFAIMETIGPAVAAPVYNTGIYVNTLESFPSAYLYFGPLLYVACMVIIIWMYFRMKRSEPPPKKSNDITLKTPESLQTTHM